VIEDGESVLLSREGLVRGPDEEVSKRMVDGSGRILDWGDVRDRRRIGKSGLVVASLAIDRSTGTAMGVAVSGRGMTLPSAMREDLRALASSAVDGRESLQAMEQSVRNVIREGVRSRTGMVPEVEVQLVVIG
jgi:mRNA degradation ribonuclease J1/J2